MAHGLDSGAPARERRIPRGHLAPHGWEVQRLRRMGARREESGQHEHPESSASAGHANLLPRSRSAFAITDTELKLIAAAAIIGSRSRPNTG